MQAPTLKELKNASYSGIEGLKGPVKLVDGRWKGRPYKKGSASRPVVSFVGDFRMTGDLDGDGTDEAVVLLNYAPGGTGQLLHLAVVARKKGKIENVATTLIGDRVQIRDVRIEKKRLLRGCRPKRTKGRHVLSWRSNHPVGGLLNRAAS